MSIFFFLKIFNNKEIYTAYIQYGNNEYRDCVELEVLI